VAGRPITRAGVAVLEKHGEEEVFAHYLDHSRNIKGTLAHFNVKSVTSFYAWLKAEEGRRDRWEEVMKMRGSLAAEDIEGIADTATNESVQVDRLRIDTKRWIAERFNNRFGKHSTVDVQHSVSADWLQALKASEQQALEAADEEIEEAEYTIEEEG
jgi:hypothetical protein